MPAYRAGFYRLNLRTNQPSSETLRRVMLFEVGKVFKRMAKRHVSERERRTTTWRRRPTFRERTTNTAFRTIFAILLQRSGGGFRGQRGRGNAPASADDIYHWLDKGTRIRYATMTPDFISKTQPGRVRPRAGRGGVAYVNPTVPRPGIEARHFERDIIKKLRKPLEDGTRRAIARSFKRRRLGAASEIV